MGRYIISTELNSASLDTLVQVNEIQDANLIIQDSVMFLSWPKK